MNGRLGASQHRITFVLLIDLSPYKFAQNTPEFPDAFFFAEILKLTPFLVSVSTGQIALVISLGSLIVAATSLGWNIYRDVIQKPKLNVTVLVGGIIYSKETHAERVVITITNFGPGKTTANMLQLRKSSWWRHVIRKQRFAVLIHDYTDSLSGRLPAPLDVGDKVHLTFRFAPDLFLLSDFTQLGISDPFGRVYWCKKSNYREAQRNYRSVPKASRASDRDVSRV